MVKVVGMNLEDNVELADVEVLSGPFSKFRK